MENWSGIINVLQVGARSSFLEYNSLYTSVNNNAYYSDNWRYQDTAGASYYRQNGGEHVFFVAPSGTADAVISFTQAMTINSSGIITAPVQPAFLAYVSSTISDVTGDATVYTVIFNAEVFDQAGNFNTGTGVFTAPVTGKYRLSCSVDIRGLVAANNNFQLHLATSNRSYGSIFDVPAGANPFVPNRNMTVNALCDMDAGDTASIVLYIAGGSKVADIYGSGGSTGMYSYFCGELVS